MLFARSLAFALLALSTACLAQKEYPLAPAARVATPQGTLEGVQPAPGVRAWFGIPYAQPPLGELRWQPPQPAQPWQGTRIAAKRGKPCAQLDYGWNHRDALRGDEDCLYLNVWAPAGAHNLPVMFYIHGGSNLAGSGASNGLPLVRHGVVLVTVDYRLAIFGFLRTAELDNESPHHASGDYGLLDQIAALQWVHDNIARFGGDPEKVMIFGQSAGAVDTGLLLTSPLARGLFRAALEESGQVLGLMPTATRQESEIAWAPVAQSLGPNLAAQRHATTAQLLAALKAEPLPPPVTWWGDQGASVDGWVLPAMPWRVYEEGKEAAVPLILGSNVQEIVPTAETPEDLSHTIAETVGWQNAARLQSFYRNTPSALLGPASARFATDHDFRCAVRQLAAWHAGHGFPTWVYQFDRPDPGEASAIHTSELFYLFRSFQGHATPTPEDMKIASDLDQYWTSFAASGKPSGPKPWPQFSAARLGPWLHVPKTGTRLEVGTKNLGGEACSLIAPSYPK